MRISLCMIIKNEEENIINCLDRALKVVDEAIVVDTGSTDKTKELLMENYGQDDRVKIIEEKWEDDFSKARNKSLECATGDWILVLDADERIFCHRIKLESFLRDKSGLAYIIPIYNVFDKENFTVSTSMVRFYKNNNPKYKGAIHEQLEIDGQGYIGEVIDEDICKIYHYGYNSSVFQEKNKSKRNMDIINAEIKRNPKDPFNWYNKGVMEMIAGNYDKALDDFIKSHKLCNNVRRSFHNDLLIRMIQCMMMLKNYKQTAKFIEDISKDVYMKAMPDIYYYLGMCYIKLNKYDLAIKNFKEAVNTGEYYKGSKGGISKFGVGSFLPMIEWAKTLELKGEKQSAIEKYKEAVFNKNNVGMQGLDELKRLLKEANMIEELNQLEKDLSNVNVSNNVTSADVNVELEKFKKEFKENVKVLIENGMIEEAKEAIREYEKIVRDGTDTYSIKGVISMMEGDMEEAEKVFQDGLTVDEANFDLLYNLGCLYQSIDKSELAIKYYKKALQNAKDENDANEAYEMLQGLGINEEKDELMESGIKKINVENIDKIEDVSIRYGINPIHQMDEYKKQFKAEIQSLVEQGLLQEANYMINEYETIVKDDADIYSIKGVIAIIQGDMDRAERIWTEGLDIQPFDCDILYNLGYLYETQQKYITAYRQYKKLIKTADEEIVDEVNKKIGDLEKIEDVRQYAGRKKVLFIAHIFPPVGGSGVQRSLKFVKYLRDFGWEPVIVTVGETKYPLKDETLVSEIPAEIEIIRIDEAYNIDLKCANQLIQLYSGVINDNALMEEYIKELNKSEANLNQLMILPDPYILWAKEVLEKIDNKVDFAEMDIIYSTSGPYSAHIIGYYLKQKYSRPWVADFRDEWTNNPYVKYDKESIRYKMNFAMENSIVNYADQIISVTPLASKNYEQTFNIEKSKIETITNGYDELDFIDIENKREKNEKFTIMHNGLLYLIRTPETFLCAVKNLIADRKIDSGKIRIIFPWIENEDYWVENIKEKGLDEVVKITGYNSHEKSTKLAADSDLLLLIIGSGEENRGVYTGKIFEYLRLCKPILALSPKESVVEKLLEETARGKNIEFDDTKGIEDYIFETYKKWEKGTMPEFEITEGIIKYERKRLTEKLSNTFYDLYSTKKYENNTELYTRQDKIIEVKDKLKGKKKIVFFSIPNGDSFLGDIINELSKDYITKKIIVTQYGQIDEGMKWADICWFEWCDQLIIYGSKLPIAREKKIVCRMHRYEALTENPKSVNWDNVDKLIIVTNHLKVLLNSQIPDIEKKVDIVTINNGVNLDKYEFEEREAGFNLAYVGYIHQRKNPILLLQIVKKLVEVDKRYKLFVAGQFEDNLIKLYWDYQIKKMNIENNIVFEGWQKDIDEWLKDKNYLLSTSIHESFGYGIAEGMSRGLKPVIHDFIFSEEIWDKKYLFNTIDEAIKMITDKNYNSIEYRKFIEDNYSLDKQMNCIREVIISLESLKKVNIVSNHSKSERGIMDIEYIHNELNNFISYNKHYIDEYKFENAKVIIGRREKVTDKYEIIEFVLNNNENKKLVVTNVWYDKDDEKFVFPKQFRESKNFGYLKSILKGILNYNISFRNNIAGFIPDENIIKDIEKNGLAYGWERAIPASQFAPLLGYLRIAERYIFAGTFMNKSCKVLEAPCGFGYGAAYFSNLCKYVEALDISEDNISFAKSAYRYGNIKWIQGDVTKLPYEDKVFNVYVSYEVFEHLDIDVLDKYLSEAYRVIKKGGKFIISTPNIENRRNINNPFHVKEYTFNEFKEFVGKYFEKVEYYSVSEYKVEKGMKETAWNMIAVCEK